MNRERALERLRDLRLQNPYFDRLVGAVLANQLAARAVRSVIATPSAAPRPQKARRPGPYDLVFFVVGEMRSGTFRGCCGGCWGCWGPAGDQG